MFLLLSPSKSLDFETPAFTTDYSQHRLSHESAALISVVRKLSRSDLMQMMHVSEKIADLNVARFAEWSLPFTPENSRPALAAFTGDVYQGLQARNWSGADIAFAQAHLRILSGLYGLLRPLDLVQAYRLEMGIGLATERGKTLYAFWKTVLTEALNADLLSQTKIPS